MGRVSAPTYEDMFGDLKTKNINSLASIPSSYPFSPERWRLHKNGSPVDVVYGSISDIVDNIDDLTLVPQSTGDVLELFTAETYRYEVRRVLIPSFSFAVNQALQSGDKVVVGYGDADLHNGMSGADGWHMQIVPSLRSDQAYITMYRDGSLVSNSGSNKLITLDDDVTIWGRYFIVLNWYNVGPGRFGQSYIDSNSFQKNVIQGRVANKDGRGPTSANKRLYFGIESGGNGLELIVGSIGLDIIGDSVPRRRRKRIRRTLTLGTGDNTFYPLLALRNSNREIYSRITLTDIEDFNQTDDVEIDIRSFKKKNITLGAGSWSTPSHLTSYETAIELREDVQDFVDDTGTSVTSLNPSTDTFGGFQKAQVTWKDSGKQNEDEGSSNPNRQSNKSIYYDDIVVVLARSGTAGDIDILLEISEER